MIRLHFDFAGCFDGCFNELFDNESAAQSLAGTPAPRVPQAAKLNAAKLMRRANASSLPRLSWSDPRCRTVARQVLAAIAMFAAAALFSMLAAANPDVWASRSPFESSWSTSFARALGLGLVNTLKVGMLGMVLATGLGLVLGAARLSKIWVVATAARGCVGVLRNTPLVLQLLFWYALLQMLPGPAGALRPLPGVFLSSRGLFLPGLVFRGSYFWIVGASLALGVIAVAILRESRRLREETGRGLPAIWLVMSATGAVFPAAMLLGHLMIAIEKPALDGFDFHGGLSVTPGFAALLIGLSTHSAAFLAEIMRSGMLAVERSQAEAAQALGLSRSQTFRLVVFPQAWRVMVRPIATQYQNLVKNSSLAVVIGYPDLTYSASFAAHPAGRVMEAIALAMMVYLGIGLVVSLVMNGYNGAMGQRKHGAQSPDAAGSGVFAVE